MGYYYALPEMFNYLKHGVDIYQWCGGDGEHLPPDNCFIHEKVMLFDDDHAILGSHNLVWAVLP